MSLKDLQPTSVWQYFQQLCQIPRPSYQETAVQEFILAEGKRLGLETDRDEAGNVLIRKAGNLPGPGLILQGHLDMVPQKNKDKVHDFSKDPIKPVLAGDWVRADGTTLGADNGIGVAMILAVLADREARHQNLEALFTASEEVGMDGAKGLRANWLKGAYLINLDFEDEGQICLGCAGGLDAKLSWPMTRTPQSGPFYHLSLGGLAGGHSGVDIHKGRPNAIKLLAQALERLEIGGLAEISGGNLHNAIPRESEALFTSKLSLEEQRSRLGAWAEAYKDKGLKFDLQPASGSYIYDNSGEVLRLVGLLPNGVLEQNASGVLVSSNLAVIRLENDQLHLTCFIRGSTRPQRQGVADAMKELWPGQIELAGDYDGWLSPDDSALVKLAQRCGAGIFASPPPTKVIHAGLECGIMGGKYPHWQMISFGPTIEGPHSPDERVNIAAVEKTYRWLREILAHSDEL